MGANFSWQPAIAAPQLVVDFEAMTTHDWQRRICVVYRNLLHIAVSIQAELGWTIIFGSKPHIAAYEIL